MKQKHEPVAVADQHDDDWELDVEVPASFIGEYQYNSFDVCLNPTIELQFEGKMFLYQVGYAKTDCGYDYSVKYGTNSSLTGTGGGGSLPSKSGDFLTKEAAMLFAANTILDSFNDMMHSAPQIKKRVKELDPLKDFIAQLKKERSDRSCSQSQALLTIEKPKMNTKIKRVSAINYFGGKSRHLDWMLPLIPTHHHYVEPFCGSAAVFFNKKPSPIETISDLDGRLINFFRVLREQPAELIELLQLTPYSRGEYQACLDRSEDPLEDARRYFVRAIQSFGGQCRSSRRVNSWRKDHKESRLGVAGAVSKWLSKIQNLPEVVARLKMAQIENRDAFYIIEASDHANAFFYVDPPYLHETRTAATDYDFELTTDQHRQLAMVLNKCQGKVMLSGFDHPLMQELYPAGKWHKLFGPKRIINLGLNKDTREVVWTNYKPNPIILLFD